MWNPSVFEICSHKQEFWCLLPLMKGWFKVQELLGSLDLHEYAPREPPMWTWREGNQLRTVIPAPPSHHVFAMTPIKLLLAQLPLETLQLTSGSQAQKGHWLVISFTWRNFHSLWLKQLKFLNLGLSPVSWIPTDSQGHSVSISWSNLSTKVK